MSDYSWVAPAIEGVSSVIGNANRAAATDDDKERLKAILAKLGMLKSPDFDTQALESQAGQMDPELRATQMRAMAKLKSIQDSGGLTLEDEAAQNKVMNKVGRQEAAGRHAIQDKMDARGTGSQGNTLAMQLQGNQAAANQANETGMQTAGNAQKRYLDSIMKQGSMASTMTNQDFRAKQARDVMNQYNQKNTNAYAQQGFQNEFSKTTGQMPGTNGIIDLNQKQADRNQDATATWGAGLGKGAADFLRDKKKTPTPYRTSNDSGTGITGTYTSGEADSAGEGGGDSSTPTDQVDGWFDEDEIHNG